jgi:hypothetical protein
VVEFIDMPGGWNWNFGKKVSNFCGFSGQRQLHGG